MILHIKEAQKNAWKKDLLQLTEATESIDEDLIRDAASIAQKHIADLPLIKKELIAGQGHVVIRGCPIDDALEELPTPTHRPQNKSYLSESVLVGVTQAIGFNPYGFLQERGGALVHEITPVAGREQTSSSNGTIEFMLHADGAYLPHEIRPETLSLLCLLDDSNTNTRLVSVDSILPKLAPDCLEVLSSPHFTHVAPTTFEVKENVASGSVLDKIDGQWEVKVATHSCQPQSLAAKFSLDQFIHAAEVNSFSHAWLPGDLLIFNNRRCLHGRGAIAGKRWLQRCYGSRKLSTGAMVSLE